METTIFIRTGDGGIDAVDFGRLLFNMYIGFGLRNGFPVEFEGYSSLSQTKYKVEALIYLTHPKEKQQ